MGKTEKDLYLECYTEGRLNRSGLMRGYVERESVGDWHLSLSMENEVFVVAGFWPLHVHKTFRLLSEARRTYDAYLTSRLVDRS